MSTESNLRTIIQNKSHLFVVAFSAATLAPTTPTWADPTGLGRVAASHNNHELGRGSAFAYSSGHVHGHGHGPVFGGYGRPGRPDFGLCRQLSDRFDDDERYGRGPGRGGDVRDGDVDLDVGRTLGSFRGSTSANLAELLRLGRECENVRIQTISIYAQSVGRYSSIGLSSGGRIVSGSQGLSSYGMSVLRFDLGFRGEEVGNAYRGLNLELFGQVYVSKVEIILARHPGSGGGGIGGRLPDVYLTNSRIYGQSHYLGTTRHSDGRMVGAEFRVGEEISDLRGLKLTAVDDDFNVTSILLNLSNGRQVAVGGTLIRENRDAYLVIDDDNAIGRGRGLYRGDLRLRSVVVEGTRGRLFGTDARLEVSMITDGRDGPGSDHGHDGRDGHGGGRVGRGRYEGHRP